MVLLMLVTEAVLPVPWTHGADRGLIAARATFRKRDRARAREEELREHGNSMLRCFLPVLQKDLNFVLQHQPGSLCLIVAILPGAAEK